MLRDIELSSTFQDHLDRDGIVLDYALFDWSGTADPGEEVLRDAARRTIERAVKVLAQRSPQWCQIPEIPRLIDAPRLRAAVPTLQSWAEFLGPCWSPDRNDFIADPDGAMDDSRMNGYAYAFLHPPYGLRLSMRDARRRLLELFNDPLGVRIGDPSVRIWSWPADWSWYFQPGHEWWGSVCWTLYVPDGRIVGIAASTTD